MGLVERRQEVQKIDEQMIELIKQRMDLARGIYEAKMALGIPIEDLEQEKLVLDRVVDMSTEHGLDPGSVRRIFEILIQMNRQKQHGFRGDDNLP